MDGPDAATPRDQHRVWEAIAHSFDRTRQRPWHVVTDFVAALPPTQRVLDLMGGTGRHTSLLAEAGHDALWLDWSRPAARLAAQRGVPVVVGDATALPLADATFDAALYVAGLHGLPRSSDRAASLRELRRVLRPGGPALVTVWARQAPRFLDLPGSLDEPADVVVPWRADDHAELRMYHLFTAEALRGEVEATGWSVERLEAAALGGSAPDNWVAWLRA